MVVVIWKRQRFRFLDTVYSVSQKILPPNSHSKLKAKPKIDGKAALFARKEPLGYQVFILQPWLTT